jgi:hypothetical protein
MSKIRCLEDLTIGDAKWLLNYELNRYLKPDIPILKEAWDIQHDIESLDLFESKIFSLKPDADVSNWILDPVTIELLEMSDASLLALGLKVRWATTEVVVND